MRRRAPEGRPSASRPVRRHRLRLRIESPDLEAVGQSAARLERWALRVGLPDRLRHHLLLVHDELASNVVHHAAGARHLTIAVELDRAVRRLRYRVRDDGPGFDPLDRPVPRTDLALAARRPGGLGIHLVRELSDAASWRRRGGENWTTVDFSLP